jgi:UDP-N-acetylmuramoyl-L-alanine---L-glutamate ligase
MRPKIGWSELNNATVGLWGLGVEGGANLRRLQAMSTVPVLVDDNVTAAGDIEVLGPREGGLAALRRCDAVVKSPGVSRYHPDVVALEESGVIVLGGLGLWMHEATRNRVACITGTKGKSTTTAIAGHLLERLGYRSLIGGNFGQPPWDPLVGTDYDLWVIETSSFQATDVSWSPPVVAVTSLFPDHLDWHGTAERYFSDKLSLCSQDGADLTIADATSPLLRERLDKLGPRVRWIRDGDASLSGPWLDHLGLAGDHNARNALIARSVLRSLGVTEADDDNVMVDAASGFDPLSSRCRSLGTVDGVEFVDDSLSTNVLPALAALEAFAGRRIALLVGGHERGLDYGPLARGVADREGDTFVVTMPDNGPRIGQDVRNADPHTEVLDAVDLDGAVQVAFEWAKPDGIVLLSPAAPSFGKFRDYRDRAEAFARSMQSCGTNPAPEPG